MFGEDTGENWQGFFAPSPQRIVDFGFYLTVPIYLVFCNSYCKALLSAVLKRRNNYFIQAHLLLSNKSLYSWFSKIKKKKKEHLLSHGVFIKTNRLRHRNSNQIFFNVIVLNLIHIHKSKIHAGL